MKENIIDVKAKDIKVGDLLGISICTYFGWERVSEVTPQPDGKIKIATGVDYSLYDPDQDRQIKLPDTDEIQTPHT
jgi:hypothetical protein